MIRYLKHELINKTKWDQALEQSVNAYVYAYSFYLDAVCHGQWDAVIKDDYSLIMPLPYSNKMGIKYIHMPFFVQQLGIFYQKSCSNFDLMEMMRAVPKDFRWLELNANKYLYGRFPQSLIQSDRVNYELELTSDYQKIYQAYSTNLKRNLKKAHSLAIKMVNYVNPEELIQLFRNNKGQELQVYQEGDYQDLKKLIYLLMHKGLAEVHGVIDERNTVIAAALWVRSPGRLIFLFSGLSEEGKEKNAMPFLIDSFIRKHSERSMVLDFEGSNDAGLARFYSSFGAQKLLYQSLFENRFPKFLRPFIGIYKKLKG